MSEADELLREITPLLAQFNCIASRSAMAVTHSKTKPALDRAEAYLAKLKDTP